MRKRSFTGRLLKPIDLDDAPAGWPRDMLRLPPDNDDIFNHIQSELGARWTELDKRFGLNGKAPDIWEQRGKALLGYLLGLPPDDPNWWGRLSLRLAWRNVPGFSLKLPGRRKRGAPRE